ncbi:hypothetical protein [Nitrosopumilus sp.]|uniref:hypothetical protein n=1 Tax=Nitrosopumilus sp. TaxID=2024843 RepID=UPI002634F767|nr:hypothetical protein [Nitrosopumilus sp.]
MNTAVNKTVSEFEKNLLKMKQLYLSTERQFIEFNEIIPYTQNDPAKGWNEIHSPRLVNLILSICPQIEKISKLLLSELDLVPENNGRSSYDYLNRLDRKKLLTIQHVGMANPGSVNILLQPFLKNSDNIEWWFAYNKIKHDIIEGIDYGTLSNTINALAGLSILHHIAYTILTFKHYAGVSWEDEILDSEKWFFDEEQGLAFQHPDEKLFPNQLSVVWSSKIFFFCNHRIKGV